MEKRKRRRFTAEYKGEAVKRLEESGKTLQQVADELGVHPNQRRGWRNERLAAGTAEALAPSEQLARVQPVAPGHRRGARPRIEALGHDPGLVLVRPAPAPADAGDHLEPAEAVGVRTIRTTSSTHRS